MSEKRVFALYLSEKNELRMETEYKNPRQALQVLLGVCEDLREKIAVEAVHHSLMQAAMKAGAVQPVGRGVMGPDGKRLL